MFSLRTRAGNLVEEVKMKLEILRPPEDPKRDLVLADLLSQPLTVLRCEEDLTDGARAAVDRLCTIVAQLRRRHD